MPIFYFPGEPLPRILLTAPSNAAVDEIVRKLLNCRKKLKAEGRFNFNLMRIGRPNVMHPDVRSVSLDFLKEQHLAKTQNKGQNPESLKLQIDESNSRIKKMGEKLENPRTNEDERKLVTRNISDEIKRRDQAKGMLNALTTRKLTHREKQQAVEELFSNADIVAATLNSTLNGQMESFFMRPKEHR